MSAKRVSVRDLIGYPNGAVEIMDEGGKWRPVEEAKRTSAVHVSLRIDGEWREYTDAASFLAREAQ